MLLSKTFECRSKEIIPLASTKRTLPLDIQKRWHCIRGSCLKALTKLSKTVHLQLVFTLGQSSICVLTYGKNCNPFFQIGH